MATDSFYSLDTSVFMDWQARYYPTDVFASLKVKAPFTDIAPRGPEGLFSSAQVDHLVAVLRDIRERAAA